MEQWHGKWHQPTKCLVTTWLPSSNLSSDGISWVVGRQLTIFHLRLCRDFNYLLLPNLLLHVQPTSHVRQSTFISANSFYECNGISWRTSLIWIQSVFIVLVVECNLRSCGWVTLRYCWLSWQAISHSSQCVEHWYHRCLEPRATFNELTLTSRANC